MCVRHCLTDRRLTEPAHLRLTSTRLFLAEDLLTAHLTLWSAHKRQLTVADSRHTHTHTHSPSPIYSYNTLLTRCVWRGLQPRFRWKQTTKQTNNKIAAWLVQKYHKEKVDFQPAHVSSSSFGEAVEGMRVGGQWLSIEAWFMIHSVLHVCSQVSGSCTQLEQQGLGVCFSRG